MHPPRLYPLLSLLFLLPAPAPAAAEPEDREDGPADGSLESVLERGLARVTDFYLHPDAVEPAEMTRAAIQGLESAGPDLLVLEEGGELVVRAGGSERRFRSDDVRSMQGLSDRVEEVIAFLEASWAPPADADPAPDLRLLALAGAVGTLDRHSSVIQGDRLDEFNTRYGGELTGIGARIGIRQGRLRVVKPFPEAPAGRVGLLEGDAIAQIDGMDTAAMGVDDAVDWIRGPEGVPVVLTVERPGEVGRRVFVLKREKVLVPTVESGRLPEDVGWVRIDHFSRNTGEEFRDHLTRLTREGAVKGVVVDVRGNSGGSMVQSARIVNAFIAAGVLLRTEGRGRRPVDQLRPKVDAAEKYQLFDGPVVVLVDGATASGSEIVAGGLKLTGRGLVIGTQTFGKGTVQKLYQLEEHSKLKLTVARYLLPGDGFINSVGVTPDIATGRYWLDPDDPETPDRLREPAVHAGWEEGKGGLDARGNPGAGRDATVEGVNGAPALALAYARVPDRWTEGAGDPMERAARDRIGHAADDDDSAFEPAEERPAWVSAEPGRAGEDRFNDMELRLAWEILKDAAPGDRREQLLARALPVVQRWTTVQRRRMEEALKERSLPWTAEASATWLDGAPARAEERRRAMLAERPALGVEVAVPDVLVAEEEAAATVTVTNTRGEPLRHLRGLLKSSAASLDDRTFLLGDLDPGQSRSWSVPLRPSTRTPTRQDTWRLYLVDERGPLGSPFTGTVRSRGLPAPTLQTSVSTRIEPDEGGGVRVVASFELRNDGPGDAGEVRLRFGEPEDPSVERLERFASVPELKTRETRTAELSLRVRDPVATPVVPIRVRLGDQRTGESVTLTLELPTGRPLEAGERRTPATVMFQEPSEDELGWGLKDPGDRGWGFEAEVSAPAGIAEVEATLRGDKVFGFRHDPEQGAAPDVLAVRVHGQLSVGPNPVRLRTLTADGVEAWRTVWVLGEQVAPE